MTMINPHRMSDEELLAYIRRMPQELKATAERAQAKRAEGNTASMVEGSTLLLDVMRGFWLDLAEQLEPAAFAGRPPAEVYDGLIEPRRRFYADIMKDRDGTIWSLIHASYLTGDVHKLLELFVADFLGLGDDAKMYPEWQAQWRSAVSEAAYPWLGGAVGPNIG